MVTSLAPGEEDIELFVALPASVFGASEFWQWATEERQALGDVHGGVWSRIMGQLYGNETDKD